MNTYEPLNGGSVFTEERPKQATQSMNIHIPDQIIREFLGGVSAVLAVIAVGAVLWFILRGIARRFTFIRMALILALSPLSLVNFLDQGTKSILYLFAMIAILLGIMIDGINYLLMPKEQPKSDPKDASKEKETEAKPGAIIWEKAE